jgi:hypothetical protein
MPYKIMNCILCLSFVLISLTNGQTLNSTNKAYLMAGAKAAITASMSHSFHDTAIGVALKSRYDTLGEYIIIPVYQLKPLAVSTNSTVFDAANIDWQVDACKQTIFVIQNYKCKTILNIGQANDIFYYNDSSLYAKCSVMQGNPQSILELCILDFMANQSQAQVFKIIGLDGYWVYNNNQFYKFRIRNDSFYLAPASEYWQQHISKAYIKDLLSPE